MRELKAKDGTLIQGQTAISNEVRTFFEQLYTNEEPVPLHVMETMVSDIPPLISHEDRLRLESPISEEEFKKAIWSLHPDKAPGPDGFPICFYRIFWFLVKKDLMRLISWMAKGNMGGATNSTFLA